MGPHRRASLQDPSLTLLPLHFPHLSLAPGGVRRAREDVGSLGIQWGLEDGVDVACM